MHCIISTLVSSTKGILRNKMDKGDAPLEYCKGGSPLLRRPIAEGIVGSEAPSSSGTSLLTMPSATGLPQHNAQWIQLQCGAIL
jgi:hypothetical protein